MLRTCLWKEWRENRLPVIGLLLLGPLIHLMVWLLGGKGRASSPAVVLWLAVTVTAAALLILGTELVAGEARGRRLDFLVRQPAGLAVAFRAKLLLLAGALLGVFWAGLAGTSLVAALAGGPGWLEGISGVLGHLRGEGYGDLLLNGRIFRFSVYALLVGTVWLLAASAWFPRPGSALLATMVLVGAGCLAARRLVLPLMWRRESWEVYLFLFGAPVAAGLAAARLSFVRGWRFGLSPGRAAAWGLPCLGGLVLLVGGGWAWPRYARVAHPGDPGFRIDCVLVGTGGRLAFVNAAQANPADPSEARRYQLLVDLETGRWRQEGWGSWVEVSFLRGAGNGIVDPWGQHPLLLGTGFRCFLHDGRTGEALGACEWRGGGSTYPAPFKDRVRQAVRGLSPLHLEAGRKAWIFEGRLECDGPNGGIQALPWEGKGFHFLPSPAGFRYLVPSPNRKDRTFHEHILAPEVQEAAARAKARLSPGEELGPRLEDGSWLVLERLASESPNGRRPPVRLKDILEPACEERTPVRFSDPDVAGWQVEEGLGRRTPAGRIVVCLWQRRGEGAAAGKGRDSEMRPVFSLARLAGDRRRFLCTPPSAAELEGFLDEDRVLVRTERELYVVRFGRPGRERVFPRE